MRYIVTCIPGVQSFVGELLTKEGDGEARIIYLESSLVVFDSELSLCEVSQIPYINNAYIAIELFDAGKNGSIDTSIKLLLKTSKWTKNIRCGINSKAKSFRLVLSDEGDLVSADKSLMTKLYDKIKKHTKLEIRVRDADTELWLIRRENGKIYFCTRVTKRVATEKNLNRGKLRPEVTELLCRLSESKPNDIVLDPFSGSGAIPLARSRTPYNMIFAFDIDEDNILNIRNHYKNQVKSKGKKYGPFIMRTVDALSLKSINDGFITKVITDPPWGLFDTTITDLDRFYKTMLNELVRITKSGGIIVLLLGRTTETEQLIKSAREMKIYNKQYNVLLSGKKAVIVKFINN